MKKLICIITAILFQTTVSAESISIERIFQSPALGGSEPKKLKVSPDGKRVTFLRGKDTDYEQQDLWEYEIASGETRMLFNSDDLTDGTVELSDEEKARRERQRIRGSGIIEYHWSADGTALLFPLAGDAFYYELGEKSAQQLLKTEAFETDIKLSPRGRFISYIRDQNLYIKEIKTGKERAVTTEGGGTIKFGMAEFVAQEEMSRNTGYWWAPDESKIAFTKVDESPVHIITRSEIYADSIKVIEQRYPSTGTDNVEINLATYDLKTGKTDWIDLGEEKDIYIARAKWMKDGKSLTYQQQSRDQQTLTLRAYDTEKKTQTTLLQETSDTWVNLHKDLRFLEDGKHFVWASERDGFKHLYLYTNQGEKIRQLTKGDWVVDKINAVDEEKGLIYFSGRKSTPTEKHLYQVSLEGSEVTQITQRSGFHDLTFSQDASVYVDKFSTINSPFQVSLHNAKGEPLTWLSENKIDQNHPLFSYQKKWVKPRFGTLKTDDGVDLHYRLYKPKKIVGKHPVIVFTYGGPHAQVVQNKWYGNRGLLMQHWVDKGYVVFTLDNRGSNYRGKAFEEPIYKKMGSIEVTDQVEGVKYLRTLDFVDSDRIGIYGHSYGGYMALMAMFKAGDYFTAGVSGAPVTDWLLYDTHYTERYMGDPRNVPKAYTASSVFPYAKDLKGALLIYHGMADDNVLFTHSTKLYKHLQDLAIPFEVMDYPGKKHSIRGKNTGIHLYKTITNFFDRNIGKAN